MDIEQQLEQVSAEREQFVTRIFWLGLEIASLFAIPLVAAILIGLRIGGNAVWIGLPIAFVLSWVLVIIRYRKISKKMTLLDEKMRTLRKKVEEKEQ